MFVDSRTYHGRSIRSATSVDKSSTVFFFSTVNFSINFVRFDRNSCRSTATTGVSDDVIGLNFPNTFADTQNEKHVLSSRRGNGTFDGSWASR